MSQDKIIKSYTITETIDENGNKSMNRVNDGFTAFELLGMFAFVTDEVMGQIKGNYEKPNKIERNVVVDKNEEQK